MPRRILNGTIRRTKKRGKRGKKKKKKKKQKENKKKFVTPPERSWMA
jgi:hypothetical protein